MRYDVIICGAGPAGTTLAALHRGHSTAVFDSRPFSKLCAELVTLKEARLLKAPIVYRSDAVEVRTSYGTRFYPVQNALIDKHRWMAETFERSGAELITSNAKKPLVRNGVCLGVVANEEYLADKVYDCTGAARAVAGHLSGANPREYALCYQEKVKAHYDFDSPVCLYDPRLFPGGYAWAFPRGDGEITLGLATWPWVEDLKSRLQMFAKRVGVRMEQVIERKGARLFLGLSRESSIAGLLVAGEANGSCDAYTGSGIMQAVIDASKAYHGMKRRSGLFRKLSSLVLRNIPAGYLQALELLPIPYVPYYP